MMFCMRQTFIELHSLMSVLFNFLPLVDVRRQEVLFPL